MEKCRKSHGITMKFDGSSISLSLDNRENYDGGL